MVQLSVLSGDTEDSMCKAIIENLDIMQISEKTGLEPENVVKGNISPEAVHSALKSLRGTCPQAKITLYNHTPLVGTTEVNHPNGSGNFNVYDSLGRLTKVLIQIITLSKPMTIMW